MYMRMYMSIHVCVYGFAFVCDIYICIGTHVSINLHMYMYLRVYIHVYRLIFRHIMYVFGLFIQLRKARGG